MFVQIPCILSHFNSACKSVDSQSHGLNPKYRFLFTITQLVAYLVQIQRKILQVKKIIPVEYRKTMPSQRWSLKLKEGNRLHSCSELPSSGAYLLRLRSIFKQCPSIGTEFQSRKSSEYIFIWGDIFQRRDKRI